MIRLIFMTWVTLAQASVSGPATLTGWIASFDATTVRLYVQGQYVDVPRSSLKPGTKVAIGQEATAYVDAPRR